MQHTVIALMHDRPHAHNRAISLFRRSALRIDSLAVASTEQPELVRMTLVVQHDDVGEVVRQLDGLIDVVSVRDVTHQRVIAHEVCLLRVSQPGSRLGDLLRVANECDARVVEAAPHGIVLAIMGPPATITQGLERFRSFGIIEFTRSSRIAMPVTGSTGTSTPPHASAAIPASSPYTWQADGAVA
ncbi:MAG: acetolactate synthase small subunit [Cytophagaceae bacterium]|nr:acetolactate synthase small subunit [Gemmatimonadaceae bacterium]